MNKLMYVTLAVVAALPAAGFQRVVLGELVTSTA
jgi:hypothetical protein